MEVKVINLRKRISLQPAALGLVIVEVITKCKENNQTKPNRTNILTISTIRASRLKQRGFKLDLCKMGDANSRWEAISQSDTCFRLVLKRPLKSANVLLCHPRAEPSRAESRWDQKLNTGKSGSSSPNNHMSHSGNLSIDRSGGEFWRATCQLLSNLAGSSSRIRRLRAHALNFLKFLSPYAAAARRPKLSN